MTTAMSRPAPCQEVCQTPEGVLGPTDTFVRRHLGPREHDLREMLKVVGYESLDAFSDAVVPAGIRLKAPMALAGIPGAERGEAAVLEVLRGIAAQNVIAKSYIGMGYYDTVTPGVILRNVLENPGWYTQYTPYQAEISQGRLEALLNFQTVVSDLTGLPLAGASLLDEGTAAAEAMGMCLALSEEGRTKLFVDERCHPQTIAVVRTRALALGVAVDVGAMESADAAGYAGVLVQYPDTTGETRDYSGVVRAAHEAGALVVAATDLLALTLLTPPGEWGADIAVGSAQRFGVPMGFGGPHAGFIAARSEYVRKMPGRIIGVSKDAHGNPAYRMAIQTREQHIRRDKATSNICTAQALLAICAGMYAVYHGPAGLTAIARRVRALTAILARGVRSLGHQVLTAGFFDTIRVRVKGDARAALTAAGVAGVNLRDFGDGTIGVSLDETTTPGDVVGLLTILNKGQKPAGGDVMKATPDDQAVDQRFARRSAFLTHPVFNTHHSEHEMLRYITKLQGRDLSLAQSMIPLGSCTMKLNATSEMIPVTWPEFGRMHPFAPAEQAAGYRGLFADLESWLASCTGFAAVSLQPNAGAQGEYAGLLVIRAYLESKGQAGRRVCLIPHSAHGTNPASAALAGFSIVEVDCDERGNIDVADLRAKARQHGEDLACLMVTYPSTHGVYEETIREICEIVHKAGGQVYMDGANMNAQVGLTSPAAIGADVCHLNLHKTFCIPHGGGGPGVGPICVAAHLAPFLPGHPVVSSNADAGAIGPVSAAPWGSPSILVIPWMYIAMMGACGLKKATQVAMLNANYMAKRLEAHYPVLYRGSAGLCAHEFILDLRPLEKAAGIKTEDVAKRLMDYGFHAPTMSFPVPGTLMIEPTESEPRSELDRFCDAMILIREEIRAIETGSLDRADNPLKNAPHTMAHVSANEWKHPYPRERAAYPAPWLRDAKFWPHVGRIDNPWGDRNLVCSCPPMAAYGRTS